VGEKETEGWKRTREWWSSLFIFQHKVTFLFMIFIVLQFLTWRAVVSVESAVYRASPSTCGDYKTPCRVIIVGRDSP
jgi:hypothetical protein